MFLHTLSRLSAPGESGARLLDACAGAGVAGGAHGLAGELPAAAAARELGDPGEE